MPVRDSLLAFDATALMLGSASTAPAVSISPRCVYVFIVKRMSPFDKLRVLSETEGLWRINSWAMRGSTPDWLSIVAKVCRGL